MRKELEITIETEGRDKGKVFHLREMSAFQAERWGWRAMRAAQAAGLDLPTATQKGMQAVILTGLYTAVLAPIDELEPLMDEMLSIVQMVPNPQSPNIRRPVRQDTDDIEEVSTIMQLRKAALELHAGFFSVASLSSLTLSETDQATSPNA